MSGASGLARFCLAALAACALATVSAGCDPVDVGPAQGDGSVSAGSSDLPAPRSDEAAQLLAGLTVRVADTGAHYKRADWGDWEYDPGTKCNTREQVLRRDGHGIKTDSQCRSTCPEGAQACWTSLYDGVAVTSASKLQIDHVVPVSEAAHSGARPWSKAQREAFYNDTDNLVAVSVHSNESKGDRDPAVWRPPAHDAWCLYARAYIHVKAKYKLTIDQAEHDALVSMLHTC
ncbi:HNH endonuclease family protein [Labedaea rhizosphaerae]|uniref:Uncharacterized protein DUF1524 n=1 Tax=Labedaea rhizosphaerae TaxID=598644 RepID=A0A4R6S1G1_LABRH|nr:HNH endonuclease family protein [Labedaea rhizosphaerae]TDP92817.1 uncharacterized protein DUF1524 [Labedaea rhizosphaerae]